MAGREARQRTRGICETRAQPNRARWPISGSNPSRRRRSSLVLPCLSRWPGDRSADRRRHRLGPPLLQSPCYHACLIDLQAIRRCRRGSYASVAIRRRVSDVTKRSTSTTRLTWARAAASPHARQRRPQRPAFVVIRLRRTLRLRRLFGDELARSWQTLLKAQHHRCSRPAGTSPAMAVLGLCT